MNWVSVNSLRRAVLLLAVLGVFLFATSCSDFFVSDSSVQSVTVTPSAVLLMAASSSTTMGDTFKLKSTATTVGGTSTDDTTQATWSSDSSKVTAAAGVVTVATGDTTGGDTVTITAKDPGGASGTSTVFTYTGGVPTSLTLTGTTGTQIPGNYPLKVTLNPNGTDVTNHVVWTSSDTAVATVSSTGVVTILNSASAGATVTITATANLGAPSGTAQPTPLAVTASYTVS
jgi:hypothetical protein